MLMNNALNNIAKNYKILQIIIVSSMKTQSNRIKITQRKFVSEYDCQNKSKNKNKKTFKIVYDNCLKIVAMKITFGQIIFVPKVNEYWGRIFHAL